MIFNGEGFAALGAETPSRLGAFASYDAADVSFRLWSRVSLGIDAAFDVVASKKYDCECLAPELVLAKLTYSPDYELLKEQRARLAGVLNAEKLTNNELAIYAQTVGGD